MQKLQEQILRDLDYRFEFVNFIEENHVSIKKIYNTHILEKGISVR